MCTKGKACGDTCIAGDRNCHQENGCACNSDERCEQVSSEPEPQSDSTEIPVFWIALGLLGIGGTSWLLMRRRAPGQPPLPLSKASIEALPTGRILWIAETGTGESDLYAWLEQALPNTLITEQLSLSVRDPPGIEGWVAAIRDALGDSPGDTLLVTHGLASHAALRALADLEPGVQVRGLVCVGVRWPSHESEALRTWIRPDYDVKRAAAVAGWIHLLLADSNKDATAWAQRIGARIEIVPGAGRFQTAKQPRVLAAIRERLTGLR